MSESSLPSSPSARAGLTVVYTGDGKGKTTAALGLALRMLGHGWKVLVLQFIKGPLSSGERAAARSLSPQLTFRTLGEGYVFVKDGEPAERDRTVAERAWRSACEAVAGGEYDAVILDELNVMTSLGLVPVNEVLRMMETRPAGMTLVLTGRGADRRICEAADIVTEMKCIKHVHQTGREDISGIDR